MLICIKSPTGSLLHFKRESKREKDIKLSDFFLLLPSIIFFFPFYCPFNSDLCIYIYQILLYIYFYIPNQNKTKSTFYYKTAVLFFRALIKLKSRWGKCKAKVIISIVIQSLETKKVQILTLSTSFFSFSTYCSIFIWLLTISIFKLCGYLEDFQM